MTGSGPVEPSPYRTPRADYRESWADLFDRLAAADREEKLPPDDLERLATAAYLTGRDEESADARARAHQAFLDRGEERRATRSAFWLAFQLLMHGERARGGGWLSRARRLLDDLPDEGVEEGFLLVPAGLGSLTEGKDEAALDAFTRAAETGERFADDDLAALGRLGRGQALVRLGETEEGLALLDEAMAAAEADLLSPIVLGVVYCAVIETCHEIFDLERATEWTAALSRWCESRPELVPYRGQCLVRRAEILELRGEWPDALEEARRAGDVLTRPPRRARRGRGVLPPGRAASSPGRGRQSREGVPAGEPVGTEDPAGAGASPAGPGRGERRGGRAPAGSGRSGGPGCSLPAPSGARGGAPHRR